MEVNTIQNTIEEIYKDKDEEIFRHETILYAKKMVEKYQMEEDLLEQMGFKIERNKC